MIGNLGYNARNDEISDNTTTYGTTDKIIGLCFVAMIISPAYSEDVSEANDEKSTAVQPPAGGTDRSRLSRPVRKVRCL